MTLRLSYVVGVCFLFSLLATRTQADAPKVMDAQNTLPVVVPQTFRHPGIMNTTAELQFIRKKIEAGEEPWKSNFEKLKNSNYTKLSYTPRPVKVATSGINGAGAKEGGAAAEGMDCKAAYGTALIWALTGDERYAEKSVEIMNAWGAVMEDHQGANWYLSASWAGPLWAEAGEIIRSSYPKWKKEDIAQFSAMLDRAYLRILHKRIAYGNRELSTCSALMAIGVFNEDKAAYYEGLSHWISYIPCYIYLSSDGPKPRRADYFEKDPSNDEYYKMHANRFPDPKDSWVNAVYKPGGEDKTQMLRQDIDQQWINPGIYIDGLCTETCRDLGHVELSIGAIFQCAEIAWHQGYDVYTPNARRLTAFLELQAGYRLGKPIPKDLHGGVIDPNSISPTYEIAYNHLHNRMGLELPNTRELIDKVIRNMNDGWHDAAPPIYAKRIWQQAFLHMCWETLTHAELGDVKAE